MMKRSDLRPMFRRLPRLVLIGMVGVTLPLFIVAGAMVGAFDRYNDWWDELGRAWYIQD
jgi:hypothetical protein